MKRILAALLLVIGSAPASAQLTLEWEGGILGAGINYRLEGPPKNFILLPSLSGGPTPLAPIFPGDPRSLLVGLESKPFWRIGSLVGGPAEVSYAFPADPSASGLVLHCQAFTFKGPVFFVDQISNQVRTTVSLPGENHPTIDVAGEVRREHTATALDDGRVLLVGGRAGNNPSTTWETFDPQRQSYSGATGFLPAGRWRHTATKLLDGRVLVVGGADASGNALATTLLFDPTTDLFTPGPALVMGRVHHTATLLGDGRVLVVGGATKTSFAPLGHPASFQNGAPRACELFDPATGAWSPGPLFPDPLVGHRAAELPGGRALIAGGVRLATGGPTTVAQAYVFDPATGNLAPTASMPVASAFALATPTADGRVLVASGGDVDPVAPSVTGILKAHLYSLPAGTPASLGAWMPTVPTNGIIVDGDIVCLPGGSFPFPIPGGTSPFPFPTQYFRASGYSSVDLALGTGVTNTEMAALDAAFTGWTSYGNTLLRRGGNRLTSIDSGLRVFFSGAGRNAMGATDLHGEVRVREQ